jgi:hypothetical protein
MHESKSAVARLRQQIALEYEAAERALSAPAITARHEFITKRMEAMWSHFQALEQVVGTDEAKKLINELF